MKKLFCVFLLLRVTAIYAQAISSLPPAALPLGGNECTVITQPCLPGPLGHSRQVTVNQLNQFNQLFPQVVNSITATTPDSVSIGSGFNIALQADMFFGGSTMTGGRAAINGLTYNSGGASSPSNTNRNYVGVIGQSHAFASDGGSGLTGPPASKGGFFGMNGICYSDPTATNLFGCVSQENDTYTATGSSMYYLTALNVVGFNAVRGTFLDAAISIGGSTASGIYGPHIGWTCGVCFTNLNGTDPTFSGSTLIGYTWTNPSVKRNVTNGVDLSGFNISGAVIQSANMVLTDNTLTLGATGGGVSAISGGANVTNANLDLNAKGTGAVRIADTVSTHVLVNTVTDDGINQLQVNGSTKVTGNIVATGSGALPVYGTTGTALSAPHSVTGSATMAGGTVTVTLSGAAVYTSSVTYICSSNDATAANAVSVQNQSGSSVKFVGTGTDVVSFVCVGT